MHFKHPEILYALFLLLIPILIHLFQLQRFEKVTFTNVKLLQQIKQQTRKSSKLKKWLILLTRLLLLSTLIMAFSQPYFVKRSLDKPGETIIYLDNSLSMQAKGEKGELLQRAIQDLLEIYQNKDKTITLLTNEDTFKNINVNNELLNIKHSPIQQNFTNLSIRLKNISKEKEYSYKNIVLISDFQDNISDFTNLKTDSLSEYNFVQLLPVREENIAIDSTWISDANNENTKIKLRIKSYHSANDNLSISFYINGDLKGKTAIDIEENQSKEIEFITQNSADITGKFTINDANLFFDNTTYFAISKPDKTNVLLIGKETSFLNKIYDKNKFNFQQSDPVQVEFSTILNQDLVILNQMESISLPLVNAIKNYLEKGANLVIIPSNEININSYNQLFSNLQIGQILNKQETKKLITKINDEHPFFKDVFTTKTDNFQYPFINQYYTSSLSNATGILKLENGEDFISETTKNNSKIYWIASALDNENSNFILSPLVVPVFYNFALQNTTGRKLYYEIGETNHIEIKTVLQKDEVLEITKNDYQFIPLQINKTNKVIINTNEQPLNAGIYHISKNEDLIRNIAFNFSGKESNTEYFSPNKLFEKRENVNFYPDVKEAISEINEQNKKHNLWQLFIIFALMFMLIEILLQKYLII